MGRGKKTIPSLKKIISKAIKWMSQYCAVTQYSLRYRYTNHRSKAAQLRCHGHKRNYGSKFLFSPIEISEGDMAVFCIDLQILC